ncbi:hypothetical protein M8818_002065 [Zalaria obscura]|uniref:Uncharacterized protein n=1 Tax=Zalaria obscura TaxID=2024903 RepID=A0ACC3SJF8_9PEZI
MTSERREAGAPIVGLTRAEEIRTQKKRYLATQRCSKKSGEARHKALKRGHMAELPHPSAWRLSAALLHEG